MLLFIKFSCHGFCSCVVAGVDQMHTCGQDVYGHPKVRSHHRIIRYIECALCHVTGVQFDRNICPYKSAILNFLQKLLFAFAQNVLGRANFALINPPFCGD